MTRKDYQRIADMLRTNLESCRNLAESTGSSDYWAAYGQTKDIIEDTAELLADENPRFDRVRFRKACGLES